MNKIQFWSQSLQHLITLEKSFPCFAPILAAVNKDLQTNLMSNTELLFTIKEIDETEYGPAPLGSTSKSHDGTADTGELTELMPPRSRVFSESIGGSSSAN